MIRQDYPVMNYYSAVYKPFQVLSQFSPQPGKRSLKDVFTVPSDAYPLGRLDYDSEGLLILTNDKELNHLLLHPQFAHEREYWVQVEGTISQQAIDQLEAGVDIAVDGKMYHSRPCQVRLLSDVSGLADRDPAVRFRKNIPTSWISMVLTEGKNRQVRKMTAKVGFPTLRLIRYRIADLSLAGFQPAELRMLQHDDIYRALFAKRTQRPNPRKG
jgi:23S rRNA pseudouridine2457 synthase